MTAEADLRARILKAVSRMWPRRLGVLIFGRPASASTGPGHPDLFGLARGRFLALEIKKGSAKPTDLQVQRLKDLRACGAYAWIVRTEEQACYAVYWTVKGWTRPLSNEPLDLSAWLLTDEAKPAPAPEFAPNAEEPMPFEPAFGRPRGAEDTFEIPVPPQEEAALFETEALDQPLQGQAWPEEQALSGEDPLHEQANRDQEHALIGEWLERLDKDLRAVGDRVTLIYERLDTYTAVLSNVHGMLSKLMEMVADDAENGQVVGVEVAEEPAPPAPAKRTRSRKKKEFEVVDADQAANAALANVKLSEDTPAPFALEDIPF